MNETEIILAIQACVEQIEFIESDTRDLRLRLEKLAEEIEFPLETR